MGTPVNRICVVVEELEQRDEISGADASIVEAEVEAHACDCTRGQPWEERVHPCLTLAN